MQKVFIIGQPGTCGGASTELYDQIKIWKLIGLEIHIIPTQDNYVCDDEDIIVHDKFDWKQINGNQCISFCNKQFLQNLEEIKKHSRKTIWVNCMTHEFRDEIRCQANNLIDLHLYQTYHGYERVSFKLKYIGKSFNYRLFHPYFDPNGFDFVPLKNDEQFCFGRISRADILKYSKDQFEIYDKIDHPNKHCYVLGINDDIKKRIYVPTQNSCDYILNLYKPDSISRYEFYNNIDVLCMKTNTYENLPRVGFECMASGTLMVVDDRGGWRLLVEDSHTGFLCKEKEEFVKVMDYISKYPEIKKEMVEKAFIKFQTEYSMEKSIDDWKDILLN